MSVIARAAKARANLQREPKRTPAPVRLLEVRRVSLVQLKGIDVVRQTFDAHLHVECCLGSPQSGPEPALELRAVSLLLSCANPPHPLFCDSP